MNTWVVVIFSLVYVGMILGEIPGLALDRTGVALLGALLLVATEQISPAAAWTAVDVPTLALLFGLMVVSAQFQMGGFYTHLTRKLVTSGFSPQVLLAVLIGVAGLLSALLANDIVCLAMAPLLVIGCAQRRLDPKPFLLALACAANVGSAATLIGNPQNMLIGQKLGLSFSGYLVSALPPTVIGLVIVWCVVYGFYRTRWQASVVVSEVIATPLDAWQTGKGMVVLLLLVLGFLFVPVPREVLALSAAAVLLTSRRMASRQFLGHVDWHLLILFVGLFVVNFALVDSGTLSQVGATLACAGFDLSNPVVLFPITVALSNLVSNVPAVMLLLPYAQGNIGGPVLALASTLAGNLFVVGSIANIIVIEQSAAFGVRISWREHAKVGIPITLITLAVAATWLWVFKG